MLGKCIIIDGPAGVGKTTVVNALVKKLDKARLPVRVFKPRTHDSDTKVGAIISTLDGADPSDPDAAALLDYVIDMPTINAIRRARHQGEICLIDGSYLSTLIAQYYGVGSVTSYNAINQVIEYAASDLAPDLTLILDLPLDTLIKRAGASLDKTQIAALEHSRRGFLWEASQRSLPLIEISPDDSAHKTTKRIWEILEVFIAEPDNTTEVVEPESIGDILKNKILPDAVSKQKINSVEIEGVSVLAINRIKQLADTSLSISTEPSKIQFYQPRFKNKQSVRDYKQTLDAIMDNRDTILGKIRGSNAELNEVRQMLQMNSTAFDLTLAGERQQLKRMSNIISTSELSELRQIAKQINICLGDKLADEGARGTRKSMNLLKKIAIEEMPPADGDGERVRLTDALPRNELDLLPKAFYQHADLSLEELRGAIDNWPYNKKEQIFKTYINSVLTNQAIDETIYGWDVLTSNLVATQISDILKTKVEWQPLTPRFGYDTPDVIIKASCTDPFDECFDKSVELHSKLHSAGESEELLAYATLGGHKGHYLFNCNAQQLKQLFASSKDRGLPSLSRLTGEILKSLSAVHPLISEALSLPTPAMGTHKHRSRRH